MKRSLGLWLCCQGEFLGRGWVSFMGVRFGSEFPCLEKGRREYGVVAEFEDVYFLRSMWMQIPEFADY